MKKSANITDKLYPALLMAAIVLIWQTVSTVGLVPRFMLPSPLDVGRAFVANFRDLAENAGITLVEAFLGLSIGIVLGFILAVLMDRFTGLYKAVFPLMVISQTIPTVAIAPLLVLWMGYGIAPKVTLIILVCFFPIAIGLLDGIKSADPDAIDLMRAMGASPGQVFRHIKFPSSLPGFFSGLKIAVSYAIVGAVISEWLGGNEGLGVYMIRVKKSYAYDKMFAVILVIILISLALIRLTAWLERQVMPWKHLNKTEGPKQGPVTKGE
ncbi:MAG: ABC-type nitrate/sulfonate/bicarbonate transport system, permease component [Firmicutes bacterium]|nr:ABC-type nitrate/sulfonate/bicarbonate transport system, permease component [Bacillota bacterium]